MNHVITHSKYHLLTHYCVGTRLQILNIPYIIKNSDLYLCNFGRMYMGWKPTTKVNWMYPTNVMVKIGQNFSNYLHGIFLELEENTFTRITIVYFSLSAHY